MTLYVLLILLAVILISGFRTAQEYQRGVVFQLGRFQSTKGPGLVSGPSDRFV